MMDGLSALSESLASVIEKIGAGVVGVEGRGSRGTGVAWSSDGLVVTADHVVRHEDGVRVRLADGATVDADLVGRDPTTDVALLRARGAALTAPLWAEPASLRVGNLVLALGRPGQSLRATIGIVSVLGEAWQTPAGGRLDRYLEADVLLYRGFSGGPLIDAAGNVLGINTAGHRRGGSPTPGTPTAPPAGGAPLAPGAPPPWVPGVAPPTFPPAPP